MLAENVSHFFRKRNNAFLPVLGKKVVLRLRAHVNSPVRKVEIAPVQGLEFSAAQSGG